MRRINKLLKSSTSLMLVFAMLLGMSATAFAAGETESNELNYVSLGDSMANGYGLDGYEDEDGNNVNGYLVEVDDSYPVRFADYLRGLGYDVNHDPMAISAMRAEDLHFILEFDYEDDDALAVAEGAWDEELWNETFTTGDYYTWREFTNSPENEGRAGRFWDVDDPATVAKKFQTSVGDADIISLGIGNANFGVFALGRVTNALGVLGGDASEDSWLKFERALAECDEETYTFIMEMYDELHAMLDEEVSASPKGDAIVNALMYTAVSYVLNYAGVIDRIVELNGDATIMIVGLMNTMNGMKVTVEGETYDIGRYLNWMIMAMNTYLSGLPAAMQIAGKYENATFLYAEASNVDMIYMDMVDYAGEDFKFEGYRTIRDRLATEIGSELPFQMMAELGIPVTVGYSLADAEAFEDGSFLEAALAAEDPQAALTQVVTNYTLFRTFEIGSVLASDVSTLDVTALMALTGDMSGIFTGLMDTFNTEIANMTNTVGATVADAMATLAEVEAAAETIPAELAEVVTANVADLIMAIMMAGMEVPGLEIPSFEDAKLNYDNALNDYLNMIDNEIVQEIAFAAAYAIRADVVYAEVKKDAEGVADRLIAIATDAATEAATDIITNEVLVPTLAEVNAAIDESTLVMGTALAEDEVVGNLMHLFVRMLVGDGIGCHPSETGHEEIFEAVKTSYENEFTAQQATIEKAMKALNKVADLVVEYHDEAYAYGYAYAKEAGYIAKADYVLKKLDAKFEALQIRVQKTSHPITDEFRYEVVTEIETVQESIAQAIVLLNTPELDWNEYAEMMALVEENIDRCLNILDVAIDDLSEGVYEEEILPLIQELNDMVEELNTYVETEVLPAIDEFIRETYDCAMAYLHELAAEAYAEFVEIATEMYPVVKEYLEDRAYEIYDLIVTYGPEVAQKVVFALLEVVNEYGPEVADWTYDFLYNNPDKVIAFVEEYGDDILPYAAAIMGFIVTNYGDEIAEFVYENRCEILTVMVEWLEVHGENAWDLIVVYLEELGILDMIPDCEDVMDLIPELVDLLVKYGPEFLEKTGLIDTLKSALEELAEEIENIAGDEIMAIIAEIEDLLETIEAMIAGQIEMTEEALKAALAELDAAIAELVELAEEEANKLVEAAVAEFERIYYEATHATYATSMNSYYVAIGDNSIVGDSYTKLLADELGLSKKYLNLGSDSVEDSILAMMQASEIVAGADLITVGFSNNTFLNFATQQLQAAMYGDELAEMNWATYVGEEGSEYVEQALAEIRAALVEQGLDITVSGFGNLADLLMVTVESYAYAASGYAFVYPTLIEKVREINPDALIIAVGMSNTVTDIELDLSAVTGVEGDEFALGEYVQYLVDIANGEALLHALLSEDVIYVDAPDVEIVADENAYDDVATFLMTIMRYGKLVDLDATAAGHEYIKDQIMNALFLSLVGDVNLDGVIDIFDAIELLDIITAGTADELTDEEFAAADVDGNDEIEIFDATVLLDMITAGTDGEQ